MALTLAPDDSSDAEITDGIGLGDLESAARLWVRHWPTALEAARQYVGPDEVPGLAAEALISTVSAIAIGRGPREDVRGFVLEAVRELGEDDEPPATGSEHPAVFVSPMMTHAFAELEPELQDVLRTSVAVGRLGDDGIRALTVLQHYYLAEHTDRATTPACRRAHIAMMSVVDSTAGGGVPGKTWLHMSTCAWCTEAFHEVAFSNTALGALIDPAVLTPSAVAPVAEPVVEPVAEPVAPEPVALAPLVAETADHDALPVPEEDDEDEVAVVPVHAGRRRNRLAAVGVAAAAAASVVAVILLGQGSDTTAPTASGTGNTTQAAPTVGETADDESGSPTPSVLATVAGPVLSPVAKPTAATTSAQPSPTAAATTARATPSSRPSSQPSPTTAPTTAEPTPTPSPTPTSTPTRCNALQHLFGLC